jgi:uncharacterized membrane protein YbhN (UPF0104 family)
VGTVVASNLTHVFRGARAIVGRHALLFWTVLVVGGLAIFAVRQQSDLNALGGALRDAQPAWLVALVALQAVAIGCTVVIYRVLLNRLGHDLDHPRLTLLHLQRHVVGTLTPVGGPASAYVFVRGLACRQVPADDSLLALALRGVSGYAAFVTLLIPALIVMKPSLLILSVAGLLALILVVSLVGSIVLLRDREPSGHLPGWLPSRMTHFIARARAHHLRPHDLLAPYLLALLLNLVGVVMLFVCLQALGQQVSPASALAAFAAGNLFSIVAPVFQGIGIVEVSMAVTLQGFGIPAAAALAATLLYRVADVWLPLGVGLGAQASQCHRMRRAGLYVTGLAAGVGVVALSWLVVPGISGVPLGLMIVPAAIATAAALVLAWEPSRSLPGVRIATAGVAIGVIPIAVIGEFDQLAPMSIQLVTRLTVLVS